MCTGEHLQARTAGRAEVRTSAWSAGRPSDGDSRITVHGQRVRTGRVDRPDSAGPNGRSVIGPPRPPLVLGSRRGGAGEQMETRMPVAAVIFDLDGVIVDSEIWWHEERVAWALARGLHWTRGGHACGDGRQLEGMGAHHARAARPRGVGRAGDPREVVARVVGRYRHGAPVIDGAVEAVRRIARHWPVAVASSAHRARHRRRARRDRSGWRHPGGGFLR